MNINNRIIAFVYRVIAFALGAVTLIYDLGIFEGNLKKANFLYFTIISNLFCAILFLVLSICTLRDIREKGIYGSTSISSHIKGEITISILLTMTVYHFILIPYALKINPYQNLKITDVIFHYIIPLMTLFDWILFDQKGKIQWYDPIIWTAGPYLYVILVFFQAKFDLIDRINNHMNRYIYNFLDIATLGSQKVIFNIIDLTIAFLIVGYFIYLFDRIRITESAKE